MPPALPGLETPEPGYPRGSKGVSALGWVVVLRSSVFEGLVTPGEALGPPRFLAPPPLFSVRVAPGFRALARQVPDGS